MIQKRSKQKYEIDPQTLQKSIPKMIKTTMRKIIKQKTHLVANGTILVPFWAQLDSTFPPYMVTFSNQSGSILDRFWAVFGRFGPDFGSIMATFWQNSGLYFESLDWISLLPCTIAAPRRKINGAILKLRIIWCVHHCVLSFCLLYLWTYCCSELSLRS